MSTTTYQFDRFEIRKDTVLWGVLLLNTELLLLLGYQLLSNNVISQYSSAIIPFVWINLALWAVVRTDLPSVPYRTRVAGIAVATVYFGLLSYFGGLWQVGPSPFGWRFAVSLTSPSPGWTPIVHADTALFQMDLIFYQFVGYLALGYLIYASILETAGSAVAGVLGLFSCVSCNAQLFALLITTVFGGSTALVGVVLQNSYSISTVIFVATIGLLYYRPSWR